MTFKFTVLLVRPDYLAENYGQDVAIVQVEMPRNDAEAAAVEAKRQMWAFDTSGQGEDRPGAPDDYFCIAVYDNWLHSHYGDT